MKFCARMAANQVGFTQEYGAALKVVKIEADGNRDLVEKYKVRTCGNITCSRQILVSNHRPRPEIPF